MRLRIGITRSIAAHIDVEEQKRRNASSIALLQSWLVEGQRQRTAVESDEAENDLAQLMQNLNASRREAGERLPFPDVDEKI